MSLLKGVNGQYSSKRTMGVLYLVVILLLYCYKEIKTHVITNPEIFIGMLCTGAGLLGISLIEYFSKLKGEPTKT